MATSVISQRFGAAAVSGEYAGAETVLHFGAPAAELAALRTSCGLFDLAWRGKLVISGEDRVRWLNGMVSNNTRDLALDTGNYSFVLNAQGRIQADLVAFHRGDFYLVETEAAQIAPLRAFFDQFIIMDDVELGDISSRLTSIGIGGPRAAEVLSRAGLPAANLQPGQLQDASLNGMGCTVVRDAVAARDWYELWLAAENVEAFWQALLQAGAVAVGAQALEWQRILLGLPRVGVEIAGKVLPQETAQNYALNHTKGCYIGQEIVERIHARGHVHRQLAGLLLQGALPEAGSKIVAGDKEVGEVASTAAIPVDGVTRNVALAYLRREALPSSPCEICPVTVNGASAQLVALPFRF